MKNRRKSETSNFELVSGEYNFWPVSQHRISCKSGWIYGWSPHLNSKNWKNLLILSTLLLSYKISFILRLTLSFSHRFCISFAPHSMEFPDLSLDANCCICMKNCRVHIPIKDRCYLYSSMYDDLTKNKYYVKIDK